MRKCAYVFRVKRMSSTSTEHRPPVSGTHAMQLHLRVPHLSPGDRVARINIDDQRVGYVHADLQQPLPLSNQVGAMIDVAIFHWVKDHAIMFGDLLASLKAGAHLIASAAEQTQRRWPQRRRRTSHWTPSKRRVEVRRRPSEPPNDSSRPAPKTSPMPSGWRLSRSHVNRATLERFHLTVILGADRLPDEDVPAFVAEVADAMATLNIDNVCRDLRVRRSG